MENQSNIFSDLLVIELASALAGPAVGMFFAELGARVIKVENKTTGGDMTRHWRVPGEDPNRPTSSYYDSVNWGKESYLMDLKNPKDFAQVLAWIKEADIVISNFKPQSAKKLRLTDADISAINPSVIYTAVTAYGEDDNRPGFDAMIQAETGWISMNGPKGGPVVKLPVALMDLLAAHQMKQGVLVALYQRLQFGNGSQVTVSLYEAGIAALANQASNYLNHKVIPGPIGNEHPNIAPYGEVFYTQDRIPVMVAAGTEKQFKSLCQILGVALWKDARFGENSARLANRKELHTQIVEAFSAISWIDLEEEAQQLEVPLAAIQNMEQVFNQAQAKSLILKETIQGVETRRVKTAVFKITPHRS